MKNFTLCLLLLIGYSAHSQIGIGIPNPDASAVLELASKQKGFLPPRLTTAERDAISQPAHGLTIFNTTKKCLEWYLATGWYNACGDNGLATVTNYVCTTLVTGTMRAGIPVSGVSQTITAKVSVPGSYTISTTENGVTFSASGTFTSVGDHQVVLHATGTPIAMGNHTFTLNTSPNTCSFTRTTITGPAIVSQYDCNTNSTGTMTAGVATTGSVTQTITATVTQVGNYNIQATANGVIFTAMGAFNATGRQTVVLTAIGTPIAAGNHTFTLNTSPNTCSFTRTTITGPAIVSQYDCNTNSTGTMNTGVFIAGGVTQTITATVTQVGNYNIRATANGVIFSATGAFTATGRQTVVLNAIGTPIVAGNHTFTLNTTPNTCSFIRNTNTAGCGTVVGGAGKIWMACNLGATAPASSLTDAAQYGDLYQWGRATDGHEKRNSGITISLSYSDTPGHSLFIRGVYSFYYSWLTAPNNTLWQGVNGTNNPCPAGFRVPTSQEWLNEFNASGIINLTTAYQSPLKLTAGGTRSYAGPLTAMNGKFGYYWSSTTTFNNPPVYSVQIELNTKNTRTLGNGRGNGCSVRCIKD